MCNQFGHSDRDSRAFDRIQVDFEKEKMCIDLFSIKQIPSVTLWLILDCSTPGLPVLHHLPKFAQVCAHCISDAIQPSHSLCSSPSTLNLSQHQELQWVSCSHQLSSVTQSCPTLSNPMDCSTPGFPVHHQLPELAQTHVCQVSDAIQPSHPLSSPSPPAFNLSQHQGLFQWVNSLHEVAKVLEFSASAPVLPMNIQDWFPLGLTSLILQYKGLSKVFSNTTVQKHQFFSAQLSF